MRSIISRIVAGAATAVAAELVLASPESAQVEPAVLDIGDGTFVAKGTAVDVPVTFVCEAGRPFDIAVIFSQRVGG
jgi:hypothetical protein